MRIIKKKTEVRKILDLVASLNTPFIQITILDKSGYLEEYH